MHYHRLTRDKRQLQLGSNRQPNSFTMLEIQRAWSSARAQPPPMALVHYGQPSTIGYEHALAIFELRIKNCQHPGLNLQDVPYYDFSRWVVKLMSMGRLEAQSISDGSKTDFSTPFMWGFQHGIRLICRYLYGPGKPCPHCAPDASNGGKCFICAPLVKESSSGF